MVISVLNCLCLAVHAHVVYKYSITQSTQCHCIAVDTHASSSTHCNQSDTARNLMMCGYKKKQQLPDVMTC